LQKFLTEVVISKKIGRPSTSKRKFPQNLEISDSLYFSGKLQTLTASHPEAQQYVVNKRKEGTEVSFIGGAE